MKAHYTGGQSLIGIILATAIFALVASALASMAVGNFSALTQAGDQAKAEALAQEGMEAVRSVRDRAWNEIIYKNGEQSGVAVNGGEWALSGAPSETIGKFTRAIKFNDVCRAVSGDITDCANPGSELDIQSKLVISDVSWEARAGVNNLARRESYLTNWDSRDWIQTDWSGGGGQAAWSDATRYDSDDGNIDIRGTGEIKLGATSRSVWNPASGNSESDTTDVDFGGGSTGGTTAVFGTGDGASVVLAKDNIWVEHRDSSSVTTKNINGMSAVAPDDIWAVGKSGTIIHYDGLRWNLVKNPPTGENLNGIFMVSASDGWAVGDNGIIIHWDGSAWAKESVLPVNKNLYGVFMVSATDGWAVGASGKILRWNGGKNKWERFSDEGRMKWKSVYMVSADDGWVVGGGGNIYRFDVSKNKWDKIMRISGETWNSVYMLSATDGWIVGNGGSIMHFENGAWVNSSSGISKDLLSVYALSGADVFASGASGKILRYDGSAWAQSDTGGQRWNSILMFSANDGWVVGNGGKIFQYSGFYKSSGVFLSRIMDSGKSGTNWNFMYWTETLPAGSDLTIATRSGGTPAPDGSWSAFSNESTNSQSSNISSPNGRYLQYRATFTRGALPSETPELADITVVFDAVVSSNIEDVSVVAADNIWIAGNGGTVANFDGTSWSLVRPPPTSNDLKGIDMVSASDGWAVGKNGTILRYSAGAWSNYLPSPTADNLNGVFMVSATDGWAVGKNGTIIRYSGGAWLNFPSPTAEDLNGVYMVSAADVWAVGKAGTIIHYDGNAWSGFTSPTTEDLNSVYMVSASDGWAVGKNGTVIRYSGGAWNAAQSPTANNLNGVFMVSAADGFAAGSRGGIYIWDGASWARMNSPARTNLKAVGMVSSLQGWIVGKGGSILRMVVNSGILTSSAFDMGGNSPVQIVAFGESANPCGGCSVGIQARSALDNGSGLPDQGSWTVWYGAGGAGTYFTDPRGALAPAAINGRRWVQYRAVLAGDGINTPVLYETKINYK